MSGSGGAGLLRWLLPALLMALTFSGRLYLDNSGMKSVALLRHDEVHTVAPVLSFLNGDLDQRRFINPALTSLLLTAVTALSGLVSLAAGSQPSFSDFCLSVTFNPHRVMVLGRLLSLLASTACVGLLFHLGRRVFGLRVATLAALALAFDRTHAERAVVAGNESLLVALVLVFFLCLWRYVRAPSAGRHAVCGLVLGLAAAAKYSALIHFVPLAALTAWCVLHPAGGPAALASRARPGSGRVLWRALREPRFTLGFLCLPLGFVAGTPVILWNFDRFVHGLTTQFSFLHGGFSEYDRSQAALGYTYYLERFPSGSVGLAFALCCGLGLALALVAAVRRRGPGPLLLVTATLPLYLFLGSGIFHRMRFLLPATPFVLLAGAWFLVRACDRATVGGRDGPAGGNRAWLRLAPVLLGLAAIAPGARATWTSLERDFGAPDPRAEVVRWIQAHVDPRARVVEYTNPEHNEFPRSKATLQTYHIRSRWFRTRRERLAFRAHRESLHDFTSLRRLLAGADSLDDLLHTLREEEFRFLLFNLPSAHLSGIARLGEKTLRGEQSSRLWREFVAFASGLEPVSRFSSADRSFTALLLALP